jgi:glycosyltransferase involved in cell wall biosynthesis
MAPLDVSILLSTRNRVHVLARTLEAFRALDTRDLTWELVAVNNGSSDSTAGVLARARESLPLVALSEPVPGKNRALNRALAIARGRRLIFIDDDVLPSHGWVAEYEAAARRWPEHSIFAGPIRPAMPPGAPPVLADERFRFASVAFARYSPLPSRAS